MSTAAAARFLRRLIPAVSTTPAVPAERRAVTLHRDLRASVADGSFFGVMVGCGETYLAAFVLAVGLGELMAGLVASIPPLAGGVVQLITPQAVRWLGSYRLWVVLCAGLQAASFLPLVAAALWGHIPAAAVLLVAAVYWGSGMATGPAWNTWVGTLVPRRIRPRYFARRTRLSQAATLGGFLVGGLALQYGKSLGQDALMLAFAALFVLAASCRFLSTWQLARQSEGHADIADADGESLWALARRLSVGTSGRLLRYIVLMQAAVQISGPYFAPYMLKELSLSYLEYVVLIGTTYVAKIAALPMWGHFAHRWGARRLLWVGGLGIVPVASLWLISSAMGWLIFVQVISGTFWAAYELATILLFFESIPQRERTRVLTLYNLANATALVGGSLVGAAILKSWGFTAAAYGALFALSSLCRAANGLLLMRVPESRVEVVPVGIRTLSMRPASGEMDRPILPTLPERAAEPAPATADV